MNHALKAVVTLVFGAGLAVAAQCHESSTNPDLDLFGFQLFARIALVAIRNLAERVSEIVTMRVSGIT